MFQLLGILTHRHRWAVLLASGGFLVVAIVLLLRGGEFTSGTIRGLEAEQAQSLVDAISGRPADTTVVAVMRARDPGIEDGDFYDAIGAALAPVQADPAVLAVTSPVDAPPALGERMVNADAHAAYALITLRGDFKHALKAYPEVRSRLRSDRLDIACTGRVPYMHDLDTTLEHDLLRAEVISLPLALLVLLLVFGTVVAAALPVGVGGLAVAGGIGMVTALSHATDIAQYTINVCSLIGLGVAIDYSLFTVARYREELLAGRSYPDALARAVASAGRVVAFSGAAVGTGLAGLLFFEGSYLAAMGIGGCIVVALAVVFALTFLPALLAVLGPRIHALRMPLPGMGRSGRVWHAAAMMVMRRPVAVLVPTLAVLLVMGVPFLHLRMAAADVRVLTADVEARRGYDELRSDFPDEAADRIVVAVTFPSSPTLTPERVGALYDLSRRIAALPNVRKVESIVDAPVPLTREDYQRFLVSPPAEYAPLVESAKKLTVGDRVVALYATTDAPPESESARAIVRGVRADRRVADGTLVVGGPAAGDMDTTAYVLSRAPRAIGFVVGITVVVLFVLLGSVVLPLKAVVMNFVSIAGSFGALVWIFQDGHLWIREPRPVEPVLPVLLFCVLFGLSMDYEVLMLSRMKEAYEATHDNAHAVADGLEKTAGLITSAAAIMVSVFGAFALARVVIVQAVGFGMALAVALDATLVRVLLVPSTMELFGNLNWWAPRPLAALRRKLGLERAAP